VRNRLSGQFLNASIVVRRQPRYTARRRKRWL